MANKTRLCFQVNNFCNLNCSYCYEKNKGNTEMKIEDAKYFIDRFVEEDKSYFGDYFMDKPKEIILDFIGGESTLSMNVVEEITEYFYKKCVEKGKYDWVINSDIWLETNGTTYFRQDVKSYIEKHKEKLDLPITLDGCKELHDKCRKYYNGKGSYDDVEKAVKDYIALTGKTPNSKLTLSPENVKYFYEGIKNFIGLGYKAVRCNCQMEDVWDEESENEYYTQLIKTYDYIIENRISFVMTPMRVFKKESRYSNCGLYGGTICLDYAGNIYNCFRYSEVSINERESMRLGTVREGITEKNRLQKLREAIDKTMDKQCKECELNSTCERCPAFNYEHTGDMTKSLKTNCRITHIEAKAFKYFQDKCKEVGFIHPMLKTANSWNEELFAKNKLKNIKTKK